jgi:hypothetical protein
MSVASEEVDLPAVLEELQAVFEQYEQALVANDVGLLDRLFRDSPATLRYGTGENLYGHAEIAAFRAARDARALSRSIRRRSLSTFGRDFGVASIEFVRDGEARVGRQTQTWVRFAEGWRVVAAHVSWMEPR